MFVINAKLFGDIAKIKTKKGNDAYIGQFAFKDHAGKDQLLKIMSTSLDKLKAEKIEIKNDFFFAV